MKGDGEVEGGAGKAGGDKRLEMLESDKEGDNEN